MSNFMNKKKTKKTLIYQRTYQRFQQYTANFLDQKKINNKRNNDHVRPII